MTFKKIAGIILFFGLHTLLHAQIPPPPKSYVCYRANGSIIIDGKLNEKSWNMAQWTDDFLDIEGPSKPKPAERTRVKMLWNDSMLYIGGRIETKNIWAALTQHDAIVFHDNDFEIFITPNDDNHQYGELEFNALGTLMDIFLDRPYRDGGYPLFGWECKGIQYAVSYEGTINNPADTDTAWTIEIMIPLKSILDLQSGKKKPVAGSTWRINFSRVQWNVTTENGTYQKSDEPEHNWVWSPQWAINMHRPEYWGYLQFSFDKVGTNADRFVPDPRWNTKMQLMTVYYAEKKYYETEHRFTGEFSKLKLPEFVEAHKFELHSDGYQFIVTGTTSDITFSVDQTGLLLSNN